jgi:hypothetical protein
VRIKGGFTGCGTTQLGICFERARLYRLRKNSIQDGFVKGHGFSRADKANQMSWALAPAKAHSCSSLAFGPFSAACLAVPVRPIK